MKLVPPSPQDEILAVIDEMIGDYTEEVAVAKHNQGFCFCYGYAMGGKDALIALRNKLADQFEA